MKYIIITALLLSAIFSASAQSALGISWVTYPTANHANPQALGPDNINIIRFHVRNTGDHPVRLIAYKSVVVFDTARATLRSAILKTSWKSWKDSVAPVNDSNKQAYFQNYVPRKKYSTRDSVAMQKGLAVLYLIVLYWDYFQKENRVSTTIMTLKDHHSPASLTDRVIYKEDKREGRP